MDRNPSSRSPSFISLNQCLLGCLDDGDFRRAEEQKKMDMNRTRAACVTPVLDYAILQQIHRKLLKALNHKGTVKLPLLSWVVPLHWCRNETMGVWAVTATKSCFALQHAEWNWALCVPAVLPYISRLLWDRLQNALRSTVASSKEKHPRMP